MQKLILSVLIGIFGPSGPPAAVDTRSALPPALAENAAALAKAPVPPEAAARARAAVRHERADGQGGLVHHTFHFPDGSRIEFSDRPRGPRDQAPRERVVAYVGTERAQTEPDSTFEAAGRAAGLSAEAIAALRYVSRHEGGFDAINTWDRARFSWGFIQFAGGYGFPPALAHLKQASPERFRELLAAYGVDVLPGDGGRPEPVYTRADGRVLRGAEAEKAFGDEPLVIALFIRAGRVAEVKQRQVEAAIRDYAAPALGASFRGVRLSGVLRSPQGLAMLIDRKVHEGNVERLEWALEHASIVENVPAPAEWPRLEGIILDLAIRDADARAVIAERGEEAAAALERAAGSRGGDARAAARAALEQAAAEADYRMVVSYRRDRLREGLGEALRALDSGARGEMQSAAAAVRELIARLRFEYAIRNRLRSIRASGLPGPAP